MANSQRVRDALRSFITNMKAHDEAIPEELAEDALEMVEEVTDALCEDEEANPLEVTKDVDPPISISEQVQDAVARTLKEYGLIKDPSMKALDELEEEICEKSEDECMGEKEEEVADAFGEESVTVDPEKMKDASTLLRTMKPMIAQIKNKKQRKAAADALARLIKMQSGVASNQYGQIMGIVKSNSKDSKPVSTADADADFGMQLARRFNPHYKEDK